MRDLIDRIQGDLAIYIGKMTAINDEIERMNQK